MDTEAGIKLKETGTLLGQYMIVSKHSGKVLDITGSSNNACAGVIVYLSHGGNNQRFDVWKTSSGYYVFFVKHSGIVLDVPQSTSNDVQIIQYTYYATDNQQWSLEPYKGDWVFIKNKCSGKVLDIKGGSWENCAQVIQYPKKSSNVDNQLWSLVKIEEPPED